LNGLEAIQDRIMSEAAEKAARITEQAEIQCAGILAEAMKEKDRLLASARDSVASQTDSLLKRARSSAALDDRRIRLSARQALIGQVMDRALAQLSELPTADKLSLYRAMLQHTKTTAGEITLSAVDLDLAEALLQGMPGDYRIAGQAGAFAGGLILRHGQVEDNLTFERLLAINQPHLVKLADDALDTP
jgi:V/A-type H+/Na+-transporting ATPase subunit E